MSEIRKVHCKLPNGEQHEMVLGETRKVLPPPGGIMTIHTDRSGSQRVRVLQIRSAEKHDERIVTLAPVETA